MVTLERAERVLDRAVDVRSCDLVTTPPAVLLLAFGEVTTNVSLQPVDTGCEGGDVKLSSKASLGTVKVSLSRWLDLCIDPLYTSLCEEWGVVPRVTSRCGVHLCLTTSSNVGIFGGGGRIFTL